MGLIWSIISLFLSFCFFEGGLLPVLVLAAFASMVTLGVVGGMLPDASAVESPLVLVSLSIFLLVPDNPLKAFLNLIVSPVLESCEDAWLPSLSILRRQCESQWAIIQCFYPFVRPEARSE